MKLLFILSVVTVIGLLPAEISATIDGSQSAGESVGSSGGNSAGSGSGMASGDTRTGIPLADANATATAAADASKNDPAATAIGEGDAAGAATAFAQIGDKSTIDIAMATAEALAIARFDNCTYCDHKTQCDDASFRGFGTKPDKKCPCCPWPCCCKCVLKQTGTGKCKELLDLIFVVDESGSIGSIDRTKELAFINSIVGQLSNVGPDQRVAMVQFSTSAQLEWNLKNPISDSLATLQAEIKGLSQTIGFTNIVEGLEIVANDIIGSPDDDPKKPNVVVLLTDGRENVRVNELANIAQQVQSGAKVLAIGVTGEVDHKQLVTVTGSEDMVFEVDTFDDLVKIILDTVNKICDIKKEEQCFCCCSIEQFFGGGGSKYFW